ncbi:MAG: hybrid sensor histidine kinase/response regulator [Deltaproteobacteria bacterium HGW-Deltaproteobacteria-22]|jgi:PAS domain S-box-containing protein|nr:MAG: hybrid sensor histidine kinase/response regulator [Deltaproteobacteria bacterium HGW-Deltaproteobacteria-22]
MTNVTCREVKLAEVMDNLLEGCQILDFNWTYLYLNEAAQGHNRRPNAELLGRRYQEMWPGVEQTEVYEHIRRCLEDRTPHAMENPFVFPDGGQGVFELRISPIPEGVFIMSVDVTQRKAAEARLAQSEERLRQAEKLESIGRLASGVAHDFNNILGVILGHVELAMDHIPEGVPGNQDLLEIRLAAQRSAALTKQLLAFARRQIIEPKIIDLNQAVEAMLQMLRRLLGEDIDLLWRPDSDLGAVMIDPSNVDQVLTNLCVNARDAITSHGRITVESQNVVFDSQYCQEHSEFKPGSYVMLAVSDDGCGMEKAVADRIFEPFFTTKEQGHGTGLGLATVYGIVRQNGGFIHVYSEPGRGTTFKIYFNRHLGEAVAPQPPAIPEVECRGLETLLVVEDEASILRVVKSSLERLGYHVLPAASPRDALDLARRYPGDIHLLFSDVVLPEMTGPELAKALHQIRPNLRKIFSSGYTANVIVHRGVVDPGVHFLQKPYSRRELGAKVRAVLDGPLET